MGGDPFPALLDDAARVDIAVAIGVAVSRVGDRLLVGDKDGIAGLVLHLDPIVIGVSATAAEASGRAGGDQGERAHGSLNSNR